MALPAITLTGNLTADPELRFTQRGTGVVSLRVACNSSKKDEQGNWIDGEATYLNVTCWKAPEVIAAQLKKGSRVTIVGSLQQRDYETENNEKRTVYEVKADHVAAVLTEVKAPQAQADAWPETEETPW